MQTGNLEVLTSWLNKHKKFEERVLAAMADLPDLDPRVARAATLAANSIPGSTEGKDLDLDLTLQKEKEVRQVLDLALREPQDKMREVIAMLEKLERQRRTVEEALRSRPPHPPTQKPNALASLLSGTASSPPTLPHLLRRSMNSNAVSNSLQAEREAETARMLEIVKARGY